MKVSEITKVDELETLLEAERKNYKIYAREVRLAELGQDMSDFERGFAIGKYNLKVKETEGRISEYEKEIKAEVARSRLDF